MERLSTQSAQQAIEEAVLAVEGFLRAGSCNNGAPSAGHYQALSACIRRARSARQQAHPGASSPQFAELCERYREQLERLRLYLKQLEDNLHAQRDHLLEECARVSRTREWHALFRRTQ